MRIVARSFIKTGASTLLIPARCSRLLNRFLRSNTMNDLLGILLSRGVPTNFRPGALRVRYQETGLELVRRDFRVDQAVWFRLGQLARSCGISRCFLFVLMLEAAARTTKEFRQKLTATRWLLKEIFDTRRYARIARLVRIRSTPADDFKQTRAFARGARAADDVG